MHTTPDIIKAIKLRMRRAGRVARMGKTQTHRLFVTEPAGRHRLENLGVDGRIIFKWILNKRSEGEGVVNTASGRTLCRTAVPTGTTR